MNFNETIINKLNSILSAHCFVLTEQYEGSVKYENNGFYISFSHNPRDQENIMWIGRAKGFPIEISDVVLKDFFKSEINFGYKSHNDFTSSIYEFFNNEGLNILKTNQLDYLELENFIKHRSKEYTSNLAMQQRLNAAAKAWEKEDFISVLEILDDIGYDSLPLSYKRKYKVAKKKISN